jgi:hypothetical protein
MIGKPSSLQIHPDFSIGQALAGLAFPAVEVSRNADVQGLATLFGVSPGLFRWQVPSVNHARL